MTLDWMLFRENSSHRAGGILADEQGLGKTIMVTALVLKKIDQQSKFMSAVCDRAALVVDNMDEPVKKQGAATRLPELFRQAPARRTVSVNLFIEDRNLKSPSTLSAMDKPTGGTIVVCPTSILTQWVEEIHKVAKDFRLSVFVYHGHSRNVDPEKLAKHDVVLTSYGMIKKQSPSRKEGFAKKQSDTDGPIACVTWYRIVLDEAHMIRNRTSQVAKACWKLEAERRWCLTGTPIQNRIDDLYSYLCFLKYKPYSRYSLCRSLY
ncbi:hypothetical protein PR202_ga18940 [Eleusine coracana subsp. coracana]|uniref:Helicase ATP-binding domain-containing protein n=1 Tax=Eleusine coracana subsp. coracana TaxID=191504 RepID=A0AAV5CTB8_ELECO|nr:hypothetical protein PR202_ga18940 [Eleusine coracana subsp. coracana]